MIIVWLMHLHQRVPREKETAVSNVNVKNERMILINMIIYWKTVKLSKEKFFSSVLCSHGQYEYFVPDEGQPETPTR